MSVHSVNSIPAPVTLPARKTLRTDEKRGSTGSFGTLLGGLTPKASPVAARTTAPQPVTIPAKPATGFQALFGGVSSNAVVNPPETPTPTPTTNAPTPTAPSPSAPFTATFEQGAYVTGPDGTQTPMNPMELATAPTAAAVAQLLGGSVTTQSFGGGVSTSVPIRQISVPGTTTQINAGAAAWLFATFGTAQGSEAWQVINHDLGLNPMSTGAMS